MTILKLQRLREVPVKGSFKIKSHTYEMYKQVMSFFYNEDAKQVLKFKELLQLPELHTRLKEYRRYCEETGELYIIASFSPVYADARKDMWFFTIKYESLNELLKLREIFNIRANSFDTSLIEKRNYNPFTLDFFTKLTQPIQIIKK